MGDKHYLVNNTLCIPQFTIPAEVTEALESKFTAQSNPIKELSIMVCYPPHPVLQCIHTIRRNQIKEFDSERVEFKAAKL